MAKSKYNVVQQGSFGNGKGTYYYKVRQKQGGKKPAVPLFLVDVFEVSKEETTTEEIQRRTIEREIQTERPKKPTDNKKLEAWKKDCAAFEKDPKKFKKEDLETYIKKVKETVEIPVEQIQVKPVSKKIETLTMYMKLNNRMLKRYLSNFIKFS